MKQDTNSKAVTDNVKAYRLPIGRGGAVASSISSVYRVNRKVIGARSDAATQFRPKFFRDPMGV